MSARRRPALLLIDFFNPLNFGGSPELAARTARIAPRVAALRRRCHATRWPVIYANDNFGQWRSNFSEVVRSCLSRKGPIAEIAEFLAPTSRDISVLKPRHSAFFGTPLEFLLEDLDVDTLVMTGVAADSCVLHTALDAHVREYRVWVPRDCVASRTDRWRDRALEQMARAAKANVAASTVDLRTGVGKAGRSPAR
jgi:nicotinamidase-related amidase